ncbi:MAG: hypothetical protein EOO46_19140 [Flavobacterium sp.]|nr:MAG: hypothetical protein EOO46_19140 [Flavobacterium sp.]
MILFEFGDYKDTKSETTNSFKLDEFKSYLSTVWKNRKAFAEYDEPQIYNESELSEIKINNQSNSSNSISLTKMQPEIFDRYFCLNRESGNYIISSKIEDNWDYCIGLDFEAKDQFLIHFYQEGKIKKTKVNGSLSNKTVDRSKPYSNGKCQKLTLSDVQLINQPVLFGIAYKTRYGIFFKAMDEQNLENFRTDNPELHQEGKKVLYIDEPFQTAYKILPYEIKDALGTLVQQSPTSKGAEIANNYYAEKWKTLKKYWAELFNGSLEWS